MIIRTLVYLAVTFSLKYVTSRLLIRQIELMLEEEVRKRDQKNGNTETPQSET